MQGRNRLNPIILFYFLIIYILIQFCWWAYHIINLEIILFELDPSPGKGVLSNKIWMVIGEGSVFLLFLLAGAYITRNSFKKEVNLNVQQKNFLLSVTHELKSPIASIKLFLETLLKREISKEKQNEIIGDTLKESERLLSLVEKILFSAKIESGNFLLYKEPVNISEYTKDIIATSVLRDSGKNAHRFNINIEQGIIWQTDKLAWSSILFNLVENALKYSGAGSVIIVNLTQDSQKLKLTVSDEGSGIPQREKKEIFKKFYRSGSEETRKTQGTGLGLYIVKFLTEQLGGKIAVRNNTPQGSIFELDFNN